jgi:hypothetical protein
VKLDLAELKKRLQVRSTLAITVESGRIAVDLVRRDDAGISVVKSLALTAGSDAIMSDPEKVGQDLAAQLAANGIREKHSVVCIPASWAMAVTADVPGVSEEDMRGFLELRAEREFPIPVSDLRLAHCAYALPDGKPRATLAAVPAKRIEAIERMLAACGCKAVSISLGLEGCLPRDERPSALHFVANGTHVDLIIAAGGGIAAVRSLPVKMSNFDATAFSREVRITLGRLPESVRSQVREARFGGTPVTAAELCGELRQPLHRLGIESRLEQVEGEHPGAARMAAEQHLRREPVVFEFLPPQVNRWENLFRRYDSKNNRWIGAAAAALLVLPVLIFFIRSRIENSLTSDWNGMKKNVAELESLQQRIREFRPWFEPAPQSLGVMEKIAAAFPDQGDVWAKSVQIAENGKVTCTGYARTQSALAAFQDKLRADKSIKEVSTQNMRGNNPIQFTIVYKTEMHDVR